ncbi:hypothetical protein EJD97_020613 [Solanum chilense]|uniref:Uncharacterized protein n=1 Tax=Solanum chilense TaxID=4083 RepID=A0A6N2AZ24_SOLCI|nr:hypothetical protein EJD97_020613 [Solanum chilense]
MYILEMLRHSASGRPLNWSELHEFNRRYLLNVHAEALLGIGPMFVEPFGNDVPTNEDKLRTSSDVDSDSKDEIEPLPVEDDDVMED